MKNGEKIVEKKKEKMMKINREEIVKFINKLCDYLNELGERPLKPVLDDKKE